MIPRQQWRVVWYDSSGAVYPLAFSNYQDAKKEYDNLFAQLGGGVRAVLLQELKTIYSGTTRRKK